MRNSHSNTEHSFGVDGTINLHNKKTQGTFVKIPNLELINFHFSHYEMYFMHFYISQFGGQFEGN